MVGLPFMTQAPGYVGYSNGIVSTAIDDKRKFLMVPLYDAWYALVTFYALALGLLALGSGFASKVATALGAVSALVFLIILVVLIESPATVTALPVFAFLLVALTLVLLVMHTTAEAKGIYTQMSGGGKGTCACFK